MEKNNKYLDLCYLIIQILIIFLKITLFSFPFMWHPSQPTSHTFQANLLAALFFWETPKAISLEYSRERERTFDVKEQVVRKILWNDQN